MISGPARPVLRPPLGASPKLVTVSSVSAAPIATLLERPELSSLRSVRLKSSVRRIQCPVRRRARAAFPGRSARGAPSSPSSRRARRPTTDSRSPEGRPRRRYRTQLRPGRVEASCVCAATGTRRSRPQSRRPNGTERSEVLRLPSHSARWRSTAAANHPRTSRSAVTRPPRRCHALWRWQCSSPAVPASSARTSSPVCLRRARTSSSSTASRSRFTAATHPWWRTACASSRATSAMLARRRRRSRASIASCISPRRSASGSRCTRSRATPTATRTPPPRSSSSSSSVPRMSTVSSSRRRCRSTGRAPTGAPSTARWRRRRGRRSSCWLGSGSRSASAAIKSSSRSRRPRRSRSSRPRCTR